MHLVEYYLRVKINTVRNISNMSTSQLIRVFLVKKNGNYFSIEVKG